MMDLRRGRRDTTSRGRIGARVRRRRRTTLVAAAVAVLATVAVGSTGAYFTSASSLQASGTVASLPAVSNLSVTRADSGRTTALSWTAPDAAALGGATPTYTVKRNTADDFSANSGATTIATGTTVGLTDTMPAAASLSGREVTMVKGSGFSNGAMFALVGGRLFGWGNSGATFSGGSGFPMRIQANVPEEIALFTVGTTHVCSVTVNNAIWCNGSNGQGQLGNGTTTSSSDSNATAVLDQNGVFVGQGKITAIAATVSGTCALTSTGVIGCWGMGTRGGIGREGIATNQLVPVRVGLANGAVSPAFATFKPIDLVAGYETFCVRKGAFDGVAPPQGESVSCWGDNAANAAGQASGSVISVPTNVADPDGLLVGATTLSGGFGTFCVTNIRTDRPNVACWGEGGAGERGTGTSSADTARPTTISWQSGADTSLQSKFAGVAMHSYGGCAWQTTLYTCWGINDAGQGGRGTRTDSATTLTPGPINSIAAAVGQDDIVRIGAGYAGLCAMTRNGGLACWGLIESTAQMASPSGNGVATPTVAKWSTSAGDTMTPTQRVTASTGSTSLHLQAAVINGYPHYWGLGPAPETAASDRVLVQKNVPTPIADAPYGTRLLATGVDLVCGVAGENALWCAGKNASGQLGDGTTVNRASAKPVTDTAGVFTGRRIVSMTAMENAVCALAADGTVGCWGSNAKGELARPDSVSSSRVPVLSVDPAATGVLSSATRATTLASGSFHICAIRTGSGVACWGWNDQRQLGGDSASPSIAYAPAVVSADALDAGQVKAIAANWKVTCVVASDGAPYCWGRNFWGETGQTPPGETPVPKPTRVPGSGTTFTGITVSTRHSCAMTSTSVQCWGNNGSGELGRNTTNGSNAADVQGIGPVNDANGFLAGGIVAISSSWRTTCVTTTQQALACWGYNGYGSAAQNTTGDVLTPTVAKISATSGLVNLAGRGTRTCATGAALVNHNDECTLTPSQRYFYEVTYTVPNATKWTSKPASMLRDGYASCGQIHSQRRPGDSVFAYALDEAPTATTLADVLGVASKAGARFGDRAVDTTGPLPCGRASSWKPDGNGDWATAAYPNPAAARPSTMSASIWVKTTAAGGTLFQYSSEATAISGIWYDPALYIDNGGQVSFAMYNGQWTSLRSPTVVTDGAWHNIVVTHAPNISRIYVDGRETASSTAVNSNASFNGWWKIGGGQSGGMPNTAAGPNHVNGSLSSATVWNSVLTADEIFAQYAVGRPRA